MYIYIRILQILKYMYMHMYIVGIQYMTLYFNAWKFNGVMKWCAFSPNFRNVSVIQNPIVQFLQLQQNKTTHVVMNTCSYGLMHKAYNILSTNILLIIIMVLYGIIYGQMLLVTNK